MTEKLIGVSPFRRNHD